AAALGSRGAGADSMDGRDQSRPTKPHTSLDAGTTNGLRYSRVSIGVAIDAMSPANDSPSIERTGPKPIVVEAASTPLARRCWLKRSNVSAISAPLSFDSASLSESCSPRRYEMFPRWHRALE